MLFDQAELDAPLDSVPRTACKANGEFAFSSYGQGDGVPAGKYVVTIVELKFDKRKGHIVLGRSEEPVQRPREERSVSRSSKSTTSRRGKRITLSKLQIAGHEEATPGPHSVVRYRLPCAVSRHAAKILSLGVKVGLVRLG